MKITLRKMKSGQDGTGYSRDFFIPLQLEPINSVVSLTVNLHSSQFFNITFKYGGRMVNAKEALTFERKAFASLDKKEVVLHLGKPNFLLVPSTFKSNKVKITTYAQQLSSFFRSFHFIHFTHFGFLKTTFPKDQIEKILNVFLEAKDVDCEICWDIDEKFYEEMRKILETCIAEKRVAQVVDCFEGDSFVWNEALKVMRAQRLHVANEASQQNVENRRKDMVTTQRPRPIGPGASGTAGEFYALSLFIRSGFIAGKAPEGTALYDLFVMTPNAFSFAPVQVKTVKNGRHWMLSQRHEEIVDNLIFCFVLFSNVLTNTRVFLVPAAVVSNAIRMGNEIYVAIPGLRGQERVPAAMRTFKMDYSTLINNLENPSEYLARNQLRFIAEHSQGWLDRYENNFQIFNNR